MNITFISNFLSPHQVPFSDAIYDILGNNYCFISTIAMGDERKNLGWDDNAFHNYEIKAYESDKLMKMAVQRVDDSDVVIIGSALDSFVERRLRKGKLTFKYSERLYKKGLSIHSFFHALISAYIHHGRFQKYPIYMLCASAYTAGDLAVFGNYMGRSYKWGYFPELIEYDIEALMEHKGGKCLQILWAGRFIEWKHPEQALMVAQRLDEANVNFILKMIGDGKDLEKIKNMANSMGLKHRVEFLGTMIPVEVRRYMEMANIYLFTSDFNEGWGAVLNEAMNSGCAVVASHAIGSVPFMLRQGENGLIYKNGDINDLCEKVMLLVHDNELRKKLGVNAYLTIKNTWNAKVAAERFLKLSEALLIEKHNKYKYKEGPCSMAEIIKNDWFNGGNSCDSKRI